MRLKDLFTVPTGEKITEKMMQRILISSICSILLCMGCLVSTTWALFTASIENTGNVIEIATVTPLVRVTLDNNEIAPLEDGSYELNTGRYAMQICLDTTATEPDDLGKTNNPVYVLMSMTSVVGTEYYYFTFDSIAEEYWELQVSTESVSLNFSAHWIKPDSAVPIYVGDAIAAEPIEEEAEDQETEETTVPPEDQVEETVTDPSEETETTEMIPPESSEPVGGDDDNTEEVTP